MQLAVNETFGVTFQGEGPSLGTRANFLRLAMCNLKCSWCDTKYTWDWKGEYGPAQSREGEIHLLEVEDVWSNLSEMGEAPLLVVTGGEPLLQQKALRHGFDWYGRPGCERVEIETNGTIMPDALLQQLTYLSFNVSPKLANSDNSLIRRRKFEVLKAFAAHPRARFKFVATGAADLQEVDAIVAAVGIDKNKVWIMPEGTTQWAIIKGTDGLADRVLEHGYNFTTRLHVLAWGNTRGV